MSAASTQQGPCCTYDFTCHDTDIPYTDIKDELKKHCKKWAFQLEKGENTGKDHYQGRFSLKLKNRLTWLVKNFNFIAHFSVTSNENRDNNFYVTKDDTRILGPWKDTDTEIYIPRDIRKIDKLLPWQSLLKDVLSVEEDRIVHVVYDPKGNSGKSTFTRYMMCHQLGQLIPFCNDFKDIMRMVMDMPTNKCYLMDMPRAINKEKLYQLFAGIEMIKTGYAYDDRYHFKQKIFDPPQICLFTNKEPDLDLLSKDRWRIYTIQDQELYQYNPEDVTS